MARKKSKEDPMEVAHELVRKNVHVDYIHTVVTGIMVDPVHQRLLKAVNPDIEKIDQAQDELTRQIEGKDGEELFHDLQSNWYAKSAVWMDSAFAAGLALGIYLSGGEQKGGK